MSRRTDSGYGSMSIIDLEPKWDLMRRHLSDYEVKHLEELQRLHYASIRGTAAEWVAASYMACAINTIERLCMNAETERGSES